MINRLYIPFYSHQKYINCSYNDSGTRPESCKPAVVLRGGGGSGYIPQPGQASRPLAAHQRWLFFFLMYLLFMFSIFPAGKHMLSFKLGKLRRHVKTT